MARSLTPRRRFTGAAVATGLAGSLALALSLGVSVSAFTATITNSINTSASAALAVSQTSGGATCNSYDATATATCSTINKYGGVTTPLAPGSSKTTTVTFNNTGSVAVGSATLAPGTCVANTTGATGATTPTTPNTTAGNLCSVLQVAVYKGATDTGTAFYTGSLAAFTATQTLDPIAVAASQAYTFKVTLPASATTAIQGQQVSQPLTWTFNQ